jgi:hypothetical protein
MSSTLFDKVCLRFFAGALVSSTNTTDRHDITEILLKVALSTITSNLVEGCLYLVED